MSETFDNQIRTAVCRYGDEHVDICVEGDAVYGFYHSKHDSFPVTDTFMVEQVGGMPALRQYEAEFADLCICEQ